MVVTGREALDLSLEDLLDKQENVFRERGTKGSEEGMDRWTYTVKRKQQPMPALGVVLGAVCRGETFRL